jgi:hypothetical protein
MPITQDLQAMRKVIAQAKDEPSLIEQLATEYMQFKIHNPQKTARVPAEIMQKARDVRDGGATVPDLMKALGMSKPGVTRWLNKPVGRKAAAKDRMSKALANAVAMDKTNQPAAAGAPAAASPVQAPIPGPAVDWVRIRVDGREIEVSKKDFWGLLQARD